MPKVRFGTSRNQEEHELLPAGRYLCTITRIEETRTRKGDDMWRLRLEIEEGRYARRCLFDNLVFSQAAQPRLELFCSALRLPTTGELDLRPEMVKGKTCTVVVETEDYQNNQGLTRTRNKVAYEGYLPVPKPVGAEASHGDDLPF